MSFLGITSMYVMEEMHLTIMGIPCECNEEICLRRCNILTRLAKISGACPRAE